MRLLPRSPLISSSNAPRRPSPGPSRESSSISRITGDFIGGGGGGGGGGGDKIPSLDLKGTGGGVERRSPPSPSFSRGKKSKTMVSGTCNFSSSSPKLGGMGMGGGGGGGEGGRGGSMVNLGSNMLTPSSSSPSIASPTRNLSHGQKRERKERHHHHHHHHGDKKGDKNVRKNKSFYKKSGRAIFSDPSGPSLKYVFFFFFF